MADSEAVELVALAQGGDIHAHAELMDSHRRIVARMASRYAQTHLSPHERIRLGEEGLAVAIETFNLAKQFSFSTYATWRIRQAITTGLGGEGGGAAVREPRAPQPSDGSGSVAL